MSENQKMGGGGTVLVLEKTRIENLVFLEGVVCKEKSATSLSANQIS